MLLAPSATQMILILTGLALCFGCAKPFSRGYKPRESLFTTYDLEKEITFTGKIERAMGLIRGAEIPSTSVEVRTETQKGYLVALGPDWYLSMMKYKFEEGDIVTVTGSVYREEMEGRAPEEFTSEGFLVDETPKEEAEGDASEMLTVILARKVAKKGRNVITLRDKKGKPLWFKKGRSIGQKIYLEKLVEEQKQKREKLKEKEKEKEMYIYSQ